MATFSIKSLNSRFGVHSLLKRVAKQIVYAIAPQWTPNVSAWLRFSKQAKLLRRKCNDCRTLEEVVDEVFASTCFHVNQKRSEILQLLKFLKDIQPRYLCEIGGQCGGTFFLFCQIAAPDARILSIDINYTPVQRFAYRYFARSKQRAICLTADSHAEKTLEKVTERLGGHELDFLFIDGDHSLFGVSSDYEMYAPLVREGGIVAFHDIVPDFKTRYGIVTGADVGQVPEFWANLKSKYQNAREWIEDPSQDGYGIGVIPRQWEFL